MTLKTIVAVALIVFGVAAFAYQALSYSTLGRNMAMGSMNVSIQHGHVLPLLPVLGAIALIGGFAMLLVDKNGSKSAVSP
jgi:hypothetical protein